MSQSQASNYDKFCEEYTKQLTKAVKEYPKEYFFTVSVEVVAGRMHTAFKNNSYSTDGRAIKNTCKALGIKYTRRDINAFLNS